MSTRCVIEYRYATGERIKVVTEWDSPSPDAVDQVRQATIKTWAEAMHIAVALEADEESP